MTRRQLLIGGMAAIAVTAMRSRAWGWSLSTTSRSAAPVASPLDEILGESRAIRALRDAARETLEHLTGQRRPPPILIAGETGAGKQLLARAMHRAGPRTDGQFVPICVSAIPDVLLDAEVFGFERGAFHGAPVAKPGLFQAAHRGTLFLKEAALLESSLRSAVVATIERGTVRRVGGSRLEPADVWAIATSTFPLEKDLGGRTFRDLFSPLVPVVLTVPPLRERDDDVLLLADHFLARHCGEYGIPAKALSPDARTALCEYRWPGNVRELSNVMERAVIVSETDRIEPEDLPVDGKASNKDFRHLTKTYLRAGLVRPGRRRRTR